MLRSAQAECPGRLGPWLPEAGSTDWSQVLWIQAPRGHCARSHTGGILFSLRSEGAHDGGSQVLSSSAITLHRGGN